MNRISVGTSKGNLSRGIDKKTARREGISFFYSVLFYISNTFLIRKQNGSKLQSFLYIIFFQKYFFLNGDHVWTLANIICKKWFSFQVEIKKNVAETVD